MAQSDIKRLRDGIEKAFGRFDLIIGALDENAGEKKWKLGKACRKARDELKALKSKYQLPDEFRVAVIGRFKAGKSSFVNELLDNKLAGEDTNPETAAITTFQYGPNVRAVRHQHQWDSLG